MENDLYHIIRLIEELPFSDEDRRYFISEIRNKGLDNKLADEIVARVESLRDAEKYSTLKGAEWIALVLKGAELIALVRGRLRSQKITKFWKRITGSK